ncbi:MAG: hypothetical protein HOO86_03520 [Bacteroidales bacterium]|nr:hypothetical protein [Bacteroidales bacterium]
MKKFLLVMLLSIPGLGLMANPIATPIVEISELLFHPTTGWQLELEYLYAEQELYPIDSIWICSSSGQSKIMHFDIIGEQGFLLISAESLFENISILPDGDSITVVSFIRYEGKWTEPYWSMLVFGNYQNAIISKPKDGHSIARNLNYYQFSKDKSPTPGSVNDSSGMCGTLHGVVFDNQNQPVSERDFHFIYDFATDQDGNYSTRLFSNNFSQNYIQYKVDASYFSAEMTMIDAMLEPDTVINFNINLTDSLLAGLDEQKYVQQFPVKIYPNPINCSAILKFEIDLPVKTSGIRVTLVNAEGKIIETMKLSETSGEMKMPAAAGWYALNILMDNILLSSNPIIVRND